MYGNVHRRACAESVYECEPVCVRACSVCVCVCYAFLHNPRLYIKAYQGVLLSDAAKMPFRRFVQLFGINIQVSAIPPELLAWLRSPHGELVRLVLRVGVPAVAGMGVGLGTTLICSAGSFVCLGKYYIVSFLLLIGCVMLSG